MAVTGLSAGDVVNPGIGVARALRASGGVAALCGLGYGGFDAGDNDTELFESAERLDFPDSAAQFEEQVLAFHESSRLVRTPSASQVRQPIYRDSVRAWKKYEKQLSPLIDTLQAGYPAAAG